jgi:DNA-binding PadR family transcriptional regulator
MPAEHALLGLLAMGEERYPSSGYGYDLARHFAVGQPLAAVLRLEPGMLYHHLKKLASSGLVEASEEALPGRPTRRLYTLTASGQVELERWLREPVAHTREIRLEFLVKLFFVRLLAPGQTRRLVDGQRAVLDRLAASLRSQLGGLREEDQPDADYHRLVLELRLVQTEAAVAWLERVGEGEPADTGG